MRWLMLKGAREVLQQNDEDDGMIGGTDQTGCIRIRFHAHSALISIKPTVYHSQEVAMAPLRRLFWPLRIRFGLAGRLATLFFLESSMAHIHVSTLLSARFCPRYYGNLQPYLGTTVIYGYA